MSVNLETRGADVRDDLKALGHDIRQLAAALADEAKARVANLQSVATDRAHLAQETIVGKLNQKPAATIGVAAAFGLILGLLLTNRR